MVNTMSISVVMMLVLQVVDELGDSQVCQWLHLYLH